MMPQWVGVVLILILAVVMLWIILFLVGLLTTEDLWESTVSATKLTAFLAGIAVVTLTAGALLTGIYTASGLGS